ncbi:MAG: ferrous iron transport protein A [Balneola sp.]|nr:MAG: ferrous iron transport protein A [Balneola sp.]
MIHPLSIGKEGDEVVVKCFDCHCDDVCRLNELGCIEGAKGTIISNQKNIILQVGEARLAIAATLAKSILVSPQ